ncbi:MAG: hypothetical protein ACPGPS_03980 [Rubripirellula sp.]
MSDRYLAPIPKSAPTRVADRHMDAYLASPIGSPKATVLLQQAMHSQQSGEWEHITEPNVPKKERRRGKGVNDLTHEEQSKIVELYNGGYSLDQVAFSVKTSVATVNRFLDMNGIPRRTKRVDQEKVIQLLRRGTPQNEIAAIMGCSRSAINRISQGMKRNDQSSQIV